MRDEPTENQPEGTVHQTIQLSEVLDQTHVPELNDTRIESLQERIKSVGLWDPLHLTTEYTLVQDTEEQHIAAALDALDVEHLEIIYSSDTHHLVVPAEQYSISDDLARKAAKLRRGGKAAKADYIVSYIEDRVFRWLPDAKQPPSTDDGNVHVKLLNSLDNTKRDDRDQDYSYNEKVKQELKSLLTTVDLSASRAREYAQAYLESHEEDLTLFRNGEISLEMLNTRRRIRDSDIADHHKELLIEWSDTEAFNAPQLADLLTVAQTNFTDLLDEVQDDNLSPSRAKRLAEKADEKDLTRSERSTILRKIRRQEDDIDEYLERKLPDELEERFDELTAGDWLSDNETEHYRTEIATRYENDEDVSGIFEELTQRKEEYTHLPELPKEIPESQYENELGMAVSQDENRKLRATLQDASDPVETFEGLKQDYEEKRKKATPKQDRLEARLNDVHTVSDAVWAQSLADRDPTIHKAPPLVDRRHGDIQVFFHKSQPTETHSGMGEEVDDNSVDLFFFSPPYFTQRSMKFDYLQEVEGVDDPHEEELTEDVLDAGFDVYCEEMMKLFQTVYDKLKPHRYFLLNISDHTVKEGNDLSKRYPISEYLASQIHSPLHGFKISSETSDFTHWHLE